LCKTWECYGIMKSSSFPWMKKAGMYAFFTWLPKGFKSSILNLCYVIHALPYLLSSILWRTTLFHLIKKAFHHAFRQATLIVFRGLKRVSQELNNRFNGLCLRTSKLWLRPYFCPRCLCYLQYPSFLNIWKRSLHHPASSSPAIYTILTRGRSLQNRT